MEYERVRLLKVNNIRADQTTIINDTRGNSGKPGVTFRVSYKYVCNVKAYSVRAHSKHIYKPNVNSKVSTT